LRKPRLCVRVSGDRRTNTEGHPHRVKPPLALRVARAS